MGLFLHLLIHFSLSLLTGLAVWLWQGDFLISVGFAFLGGFLIDVDHLIDYFLAFKFKFNFKWFGEGRQFLETNRIFILFHGWELAIILFGTSFLLQGTTRNAILAFSLSLLVHLISDCFINHGVKPSSYFLSCRIKKNFKLEKLVTKEHWKEHQEKKKNLKD